ncbi:TPA: EpsG family protein [Klebsiella quasipneumoniae subsp. similipneumoniae]
MAFMIINISLFIFSFFNSKLVFKVSIFITFLYCSLTFGRGYDWINYYDYYNSIAKGYDTMPFEPGYYYVMVLFSYFSAPFSLLTFFTTVFFFVVIYKFCIETKKPSLNFFTIFAFMGFFMFSEQIRQGVAVCIIMLAIPYFERNEKWKACIFIALAMLFHVSAIFCFLYFSIMKTEGNFSKLKFISGSLLFVMLALYVWNNPGVLSFIPFLYDKMSAYNESYGEDAASVLKIFLSKAAFIYIFVFLICFLFLKDGGGKEIDRAIKSSFFMVLTKLTFFLARFQFYAVPTMVMGLDEYFSSKGRNGRISIYKTAYLCVIFLISLVPYWSEIYSRSLASPLYIISSQSDIEHTIGRRCMDLFNYDKENNAIKRCL